MAEFFGSYAIWTIWIILGLMFLVMFVVAPCHAVFLLPFVGLPMFWLLPLGYALPINIAAWLATPVLYWLIRRAMRKPTQDGFHSLIGTEAKVVSKRAPDHSARYLVRAQDEGELWSAYSTDVLNIGEWVNIVAVKGIGVVVEQAENRLSHAETKLAGVKNNERHCH
ncbi:NfeD family protein [Chloroflexota bacterium]